MNANITEVELTRQSNIELQFSDLEKAVINKYLFPEEKTFFIGQFMELGNNNNKKRTLMSNFQKIVSDMEPEIVINGNIIPFLKKPNKSKLRQVTESIGTYANPGKLYAGFIMTAMSPLLLPVSYFTGRLNSHLAIYKEFLTLNHDRTHFFDSSFNSGFRHKLHNTFKNALNFYDNQFFAKIIVSYIFEILKLSPDTAFFYGSSDPRVAYFSSQLHEIAAYGSFERNSKKKLNFYRTGINVLLGIYQSLNILAQDIEQISQQINSGNNSGANSLRTPLLGAEYSGGKKKKSTKSLKKKSIKSKSKSKTKK